VRRLPTSLCVAVLAGLAAAPAAGALVQVDRGLAGVRLGNSWAEVRAALGPPSSSASRRNPFGRFVRYRYAGGITVLFKSGQEVTSVSTTGRGDRTARGVGVGSSEATVARLVRGVTCESPGGVRSCHTGRFEPGQRVTDFTIRNSRVSRITIGIVID